MDDRSFPPIRRTTGKGVLPRQSGKAPAGSIRVYQIITQLTYDLFDNTYNVMYVVKINPTPEGRVTERSGKYERLKLHLAEQTTTPVAMSFEQVEGILGFPLPRSARLHQAWWANQPKGHSLAWMNAGFRTSAVSLDEERLTFVALSDAGREGRSAKAIRRLTIAEAKEGLGETFGVDPSQIEITIKG